MKKIFVVGLAALFLSACSDTEEKTESVEPTVQEEPETNEPTQAELDAQLKEEATQANFVELNSDDAEQDKKVFAEGEITNIEKEGSLGVFTLTTEETSGDGMYTVNVLATDVDFAKGDQVKVYGTYSGKDDLGFPVITATIIE